MEQLKQITFPSSPSQRHHNSSPSRGLEFLSIRLDVEGWLEEFAPNWDKDKADQKSMFNLMVGQISIREFSDFCDKYGLNLWGIVSNYFPGEKVNTGQLRQIRGYAPETRIDLKHLFQLYDLDHSRIRACLDLGYGWHYRDEMLYSENLSLLMLRSVSGYFNIDFASGYRAIWNSKPTTHQLPKYRVYT